MALTIANESNIGAGGGPLTFFFADQPVQGFTTTPTTYTTTQVTVPMGQQTTIAYVAQDSSSQMSRKPTARASGQTGDRRYNRARRSETAATIGHDGQRPPLQCGTTVRDRRYGAELISTVNEPVAAVRSAGPPLTMR
jgi:hypothetical protein